jgi:hypothetical protein
MKHGEDGRSSVHTHTRRQHADGQTRDEETPRKHADRLFRSCLGLTFFPFACICNSEFSFCYFPFFCLPRSRRSLSCLLFRECERNDSRHFSKVLLLLLVVLCS